MCAVGALAPRVAVLGERRAVRAISEEGGGNGDSLVAEAVDPATVTSEAGPDPVDCLVLDSTHPDVDAVETVGQWAEERPAVPVIVLTGEWDEERVLQMVNAGAAETLPGEIVDSDPELFVERVSAAVDSAVEERSLTDVYDDVGDGVTLHDPLAGELLEANGKMSELTGYDQETLRERGIGGISVAEEGYTEARAYEILRAVATSGDAESVEWVIETAAGERRRLEANFTAATMGGGRAAILFRDLTERRELEETYREIFENVSDGLVVHHPETGEILDVNDRFCEMNGYDREELLGETVDIVTGSGYTYECVLERIRAAREEGAQLFEWRNQRADGETFPVEVHLSVVSIRGKERVLGSVRDITDRRRTERRLTAILDRIDDAIYLTSATELTRPSQTPDYLSSGYEDIWGQPLDSLREKYENGFFETLHPEDEAEYREFVERLAREIETDDAADSYTMEYRIERPDGEIRWVHSEYYPLDWGRTPRRVVIVSRDVTERKRTARNLRMIAERVDEAIYMSSPDKSEVYYASPSFEDLWDIPTERIYEDPQAFIDRVHPDDREWFREEYERIRRDLTDPDREPQDTYELEYRVRHGDDSVRWISVRGYPVYDGTGDVDRWIAVNREVTERKARERRIASFDDATDDLATADTPEEAAEMAVTAATETLNLPAVAVFLYDDDDGVLRPEAFVGAFSEDIESEPIRAGDGRLWETFTKGSVAAADSAGDRSGVADGGVSEPLAELADWRALSLGTHGVLLAGSTDESFDPETVQATHILAATLEAALNHLRGQRRLAAQEEQLRTQTERAERLDRIASLTQQVEAAITDASTSGDVERAVCQRLVDPGPYDLAWIGDAGVGAERLTPRTVVGASEEFVQTNDLRTDEDTADPHPAVTAWESGEVRVENSLVNSGLTGEWRQHGLSAGYQSICAVPLTDDGITHGVLVIGNDEPGAFGDRERDVLSQLGTSIANALAAIERRRALESDETVELEFRGSGDELSFAAAAAAADCRVRLERTVARQDGSVSLYFSFEGDVPSDLEAVVDRTFPGSVDVVADGSSPLFEVRTDGWFGAPLAEYGGMLREASADPGETTIVVEVPEQADVRSFVERLQAVAPSLELVAKRQHRERDRTPATISDRLGSELTDRQLEVLQTALSAGYFEWPRDHDGSEVADRLGITQPTFNKHLRIAERETFELLFGDGP
ncbi:PAS domain S-box protein [Halobellus rarus]|uniref:PAS domain S-box protein n=1 Tax=Halobellus rarus TaxID=1126237 RepID=A0ABD6CQI3_9EURY|nr:PAS domain S-box protein [Halobellus rarus]